MHSTVNNSCRVVSVNEKRAHLNTFVKKSLSSLQRRLKRRNCEKGIELRVCLGCEDEYNKYEYERI